MNTYSIIQKEAIDRYFTHLSQFGYMDDVKTLQTVFSVLLIDSIKFFNEYITPEFTFDVERILKKMECCVCTIDYNDFSKLPLHPYYTINN